MKCTKRSGFTLIELVIVISIVCTFVGLLFPLGTAIRDKALRLKTQIQYLKIQEGIEAYKKHYKHYPSFLPRDCIVDLNRYWASLLKTLSGEEKNDWNPQGIEFYEPSLEDQIPYVDALGNDQIYLLIRDKLTIQGAKDLLNNYKFYPENTNDSKIFVFTVIKKG